MTLLPVIAREMRAAARQPFTYYVRTLSVGALLLVSLVYALDSGLDQTQAECYSPACN
jgi:hypothetical protein